MNTKLPSGTLDKLWADANHWRAGIIYVCKNDPRVIVPKKPKWGGWTFNFAHAAAWLVLLVCLLSISVPFLGLVAMRLIGMALCYEVMVVAFWCPLSWMLSSPGRFE